MNDPTCIIDVLPFYANDSRDQQYRRESAALEAAGFVLTAVAVPGQPGCTYPKWVRDGSPEHMSTDDALRLPLPPAALARARRASRSRKI